jgi:fucose 4-O-acetylase-like acetyltransferase
MIFWGRGMKTRSITIDILKGYGIILVVAAHASLPHGGMISMFHMAIFFIASGFCFNFAKKSIDGNYVIQFIKKRIKNLYVPFVGYNIFFLISRNFLIKLNIYTDNAEFLEGTLPGHYWGLVSKMSKSEILSSLKEILLFQGEQQLEGGAWFLRAMFSASILFIIIEYMLEKLVKNKKYLPHIRWFIAIVFLIIGNYIGKHNISYRLGLHSMFSIYFLLSLGLYLRQQKYFECNKDNYLLNILCILFSLTVLLSLEGQVSVDLNASVLSSVPMFVLVSLLGWLLLWCMSCLTEKIKYAKNIVAYCGRNSLVILMLHFLSFKLITLIQIYIFKFPDYELAAFPCLITDGMWCVAYLLVGVVFPLLLSFIWKKIYKGLKHVCTQ